MSRLTYNPMYFKQTVDNFPHATDVLKALQDPAEDEKKLESERIRYESELEDLAKRTQAYRPSTDWEYEVKKRHEDRDTQRQMQQELGTLFTKPETGSLYENLLDPTIDENVLTVAITEQPGAVINPAVYARDMDINEITFRARSSWNYLANKEQEGPQVNELITMNAQTLRYIGERARGDTLWKDIDPELARMFKEDPLAKAVLDAYTGLAPFFFDVRGGIQFFGSDAGGYLARNPWEVLSDLPVPDDGDPNTVDWDPKKAIELLPARVKYALFTQIGISPEALLDPKVSKNPYLFKFFIADAIDSYAMSRVQQEYEKQNGWLDRTTWLTVYPLIRDSINSNDTMADLAIIGGAWGTGAALTAYSGGAAAPVGGAVGAAGTVAGVGRFGLRTAARVLPTLYRAIFTPSRILKGRHVLSTGFRYIAPHHATESLLKLAAKYSPKAKRLLYGDTPDVLPEPTTWKAMFTGTSYIKAQAPILLRFVGRSLINGAGQGAVEDIVRQKWEIQTGFKDSYKWDKVWYNIKEEAIGEVFLGGLLNFSSSPLKTLDIRVDAINAFREKSSEVYGEARKAVVEATWNKISKKTRNRINRIVGLNLGINTDHPSLSIDQQVRIMEARFEFLEKIIAVETASGIDNLAEPGKSSSPLFNELVGLLHRSSQAYSAMPEEEGLQKAHEELVGFLNGAMRSKGQDTLTADAQQQFLRDVIIRIMSSKAELSGNAKLEEQVRVALWRDKKRKDSKTPLTDDELHPSQISPEEMTALAKEVQESETRFIAHFAQEKEKNSDGTVNQAAIIERLGQTVVPVKPETRAAVAEALQEKADETGKTVTTKMTGQEVVTSPKSITAETKREQDKQKATESKPKTTTTTTTTSPKLVPSGFHTTNDKTWTAPVKIKDVDYIKDENGEIIETISGINGVFGVLEELTERGMDPTTVMAVFWEKIPEHKMDPVTDKDGKVISNQVHAAVNVHHRVVVEMISSPKDSPVNEKAVVSSDPVNPDNVIEMGLFLFGEGGEHTPMTSLTKNLGTDPKTGKVLATTTGAVRFLSKEKGLTKAEAAGQVETPSSGTDDKTFAEADVSGPENGPPVEKGKLAEERPLIATAIVASKESASSSALTEEKKAELRKKAEESAEKLLGRCDITNKEKK